MTLAPIRITLHGDLSHLGIAESFSQFPETTGCSWQEEDSDSLLQSCHTLVNLCWLSIRSGELFVDSYGA